MGDVVQVLEAIGAVAGPLFLVAAIVVFLIWFLFREQLRVSRDSVELAEKAQGMADRMLERLTQQEKDSRRVLEAARKELQSVRKELEEKATDLESKEALASFGFHEIQKRLNLVAALTADFGGSDPASFNVLHVDEPPPDDVNPLQHGRGGVDPE